MLGTFRLILALSVALSHADFRIAGLNPGVIAVVCFYLISGYVMTGLLRSHYRGMARVPHFYLDRALRIFPQYLAIAGITLAWFYSTGRPTAFLQHMPDGRELLQNLLVVPLNYFMFNHSEQFTLVPPAWSLGAEIQFYLLMPVLLWWRLRTVGFVLALAVFLCASWGVLNTDTFGYRLLPGVLVFFLLGSALFDFTHVAAKKPQDQPAAKRHTALRFTVLACLATLLMALVLEKSGHLGLPYNRETFIGLLIGVPLLYLLGPLPQHALDNRLGDLSYGVFLNHFLLQWGGIGVPQGVLAFSGYLALSLGLSYLTQKLVEQPVLRWRRNIRRERGEFKAATAS